MAQFFESWYPSLVSAVSVTLTALLLFSSPLRSWRDVFIQGCMTLLPSTLTVSAIAVGFMATSQSLLLSLGDTDVVKKMKAKGHYKRLLQFLGNAISVSFLLAVMSAFLSTLHMQKGGFWRFTVLGVWVYLGFCSVLCYYRASAILRAILFLEFKENNLDATPEWKAFDER